MLALLAAAPVLGAVLAWDVALGGALVAALVFAAVALVRLQLGIALWLPLVFLGALPGVDLAWHAGVLVLGAAWLGWLGTRDGAARAAVREHLPVCALGAGVVVWLALSLAWAEKPAAAATVLLAWVTSAAMFVVVVTATRAARDVRLLLGAFIAGVALSVLIGVVVNDVGNASPTVDSLALEEGRLRGVIGDPNYLAASLVPAVALVLGFAVAARSRSARLALAGLAAALVVGLIATESRGGLIAAAVAVAAGLVFARGQRRALLAGVVLVGVAGGLWLAASPVAWERLTSAEDRGNGRLSLATVAWRIVEDRPALGVGLDNFAAHSPRYVREPGELDFVNFIAERGLPVHNAYLQLLAETGPVGLLLFLAFAFACLRAAWRARRRFEEQAERGLAALALAVLAGGIGTLTASVFLSNGSDVQLWLLLAAGPALAGVARARSAPASAPPQRHPADGEPATPLAPAARG